MKEDCSIRTARVVACYPNHAVVAFVQNSACSGCHVASACTIMDKKDRQITVYQDTTGISVGDLVHLKSSRFAEFKAIIFSFVVPIVLLLTSAFIGIYALAFTEIVTIGTSLGIIVLYYLSLALFRKPMQKSIYFTIEKISNSQ